MSDTLPIITDDDSSANFRTQHEQTQLHSQNVGGAAVSSSNVQYEELLGGVPCPSCNGVGRIPKELEKQLVALIPFTDSRLKPRKTWIWVILAVFICLIISGLLLFFLIPRSVALLRNESPVVSIKVVSWDNSSKLVINFLNSIYVSNDNFFNVIMTNATSSVLKVVYPDNHEVIGRGVNNTRMKIPMKSTDFLIQLNHTVAITDWALLLCTKYYTYVRLYFQFTLTFEYFGHQEQETCETSQLVCCSPVGDCAGMLNAQEIAQRVT